MVILQIPPLSIDQISKIGLPSLPADYLNYIAVFSLLFFLLSLIRLNLKLRILAGIFVAIALASVAFLPASISSKVSPFTGIITNITKSLGSQGTLIASGALIVAGFIASKLLDILLGLMFGRGGATGRFMFKKVIKKSGEPTPGMERKLRHLEQQRDHLISQLKGAKGDPAREMKVEKQINKVNEKINILKAKLGMPITA